MIRTAASAPMQLRQTPGRVRSGNFTNLKTVTRQEAVQCLAWEAGQRCPFAEHILDIGFQCPILQNQPLQGLHMSQRAISSNRRVRDKTGWKSELQKTCYSRKQVNAADAVQEPLAPSVKASLQLCNPDDGPFHMSHNQAACVLR